MNKLVKLPLFLGITGASCALLLTGVYYLTNPIIINNQLTKENKAYIDLFNDYDSSFNIEGNDLKDEDISDSLYNNGVRTIKVINKVKGKAYKCESNGRNGTISFIVAFSNNKVIGYSNITNSEDAGYGKELLENKIPSLFNKGIDASKEVLSKTDYTGATITGNAISKVIEVCRIDYLNYLKELNSWIKKVS